MSLCSKLPLSSSHAFSFVGLIFECVHKRPVGTELARARCGSDACADHQTGQGRAVATTVRNTELLVFSTQSCIRYGREEGEDGRGKARYVCWHMSWSGRSLWVQETRLGREGGEVERRRSTVLTWYGSSCSDRTYIDSASSWRSMVRSSSP